MQVWYRSVMTKNYLDSDLLKRITPRERSKYDILNLQSLACFINYKAIVVDYFEFSLLS